VSVGIERNEVDMRSRSAGNVATIIAAGCLVLLLVVVWLRGQQSIGDGFAIPVVLVLALGFAGCTVWAGVVALRRRGSGR
jgi:hypothetical protein